jgi:peroxiredoxin Q/BCP
VVYFAASVDDAETNKKFAESLDADYPILSDPDKKVAEAYGVLKPEGYATRWTFYIGPDGKILAIDKQVKPATAGHDIAVRLESLGIKKSKS